MTDISLNKQIETLQKKADRYDNQKARYVEWSIRFRELGKMITDLANEMDPASSLDKTRISTGVDYKKIVVEIYEKMRDGTQITSEFLEITYNCDAKQAGYVFQQLRKKHGKHITKRHEGRKVFYYVTKETHM